MCERTYRSYIGVGGLDVEGGGSVGREGGSSVERSWGIIGQGDGGDGGKKGDL